MKAVLGSVYFCMRLGVLLHSFFALTLFTKICVENLPDAFRRCGPATTSSLGILIDGNVFIQNETIDTVMKKTEMTAIA